MGEKGDVPSAHPQGCFIQRPEVCKMSWAHSFVRRPIVLLAGAGLAAGLFTRSQPVFLVTLVAGGVPLVLQTLRGMLRGRFAADIVAMLAIITAFVLGQYFAGVIIVLMQSG